MCRPTGSWFWSSRFRTGYPLQRRFPHLGGGFTSQYAPVGWEFAKICNDVKSNPYLGPGWRGVGVSIDKCIKVLKLHDVVHLPPSCFWERLELLCMYANTKCEQLGPSFPEPRPGYEVYNSRVRLHQPRPQAAFQKTNKTMASNSRYDSFFFSFLIGYRCTIITSSRLIFV